MEFQNKERARKKHRVGLSNYDEEKVLVQMGWDALLRHPNMVNLQHASVLRKAAAGKRGNGFGTSLRL